MTKSSFNDDERRLWVLNDEPLYLWFQSEKRLLRNKELTVREFVKSNRAAIDAYIIQRS